MAQAGAGEWLRQEAESAGKVLLREQERVGVLWHRWEAGAAPCCGQGVNIGVVLPCQSLVMWHPQPALGDNVQTCPLLMG